MVLLNSIVLKHFQRICANSLLFIAMPGSNLLCFYELNHGYNKVNVDTLENVLNSVQITAFNVTLDDTDHLMTQLRSDVKNN